MTKDEALKLALEALEGQCRLVSQTRHRLVGPAITAIKEVLNGCQCPECKVVLHASDCAVHSEPAYPKGQCNCGAQPAVTESHKQEQLMSDQINYGMSVTQGGKRIDPMSIYKEPEHDKTDVRCECCGYMTYHREHLGCIRAEKLKEPEQEPVVWMYVNKSTHETKFQKHMRGFVDHGLWAEVPLYGEPLANQELNCVCGAVWQGDELVHLPRTPAKRKPWVGLTNEEANELWESTDSDWELMKRTEAKLREKNT